MALVGSVSLFFGVWIIGGLATLLGAFLFAELVAMMPKSGGPYAYLKAAYPPVWTFLRGWAMFFVSETASIAAVALVFSEYSAVFYASITNRVIDPLIQLGSAVTIIWILTLVNCYGVLFSGILQNIFSLLKIFALGAVIAICLFESEQGNFGIMEPISTGVTGSHLLAFGAAMRYGFFAYSGWEGATYVAEEVRNPRKNLPFSIILGITGVIVMYLVANAAYLAQLSPAQIAASKTVADDAVKMAVGALGATLISLAVMLNTFGNVNSQILVKARTWYAMSRDGLFIGPLSKIHPRYKTPNRALLLQGFWATVLLLSASLAQHTYERIIDFFSFTSSVFNVSTFAAVWVLRKKYPDAPRPYRAWGYPVTLVLVLLLQLGFMITTLVTAFLPSLAGILLTSTGLIYYYRYAILKKIGK